MCSGTRLHRIWGYFRDFSMSKSLLTLGFASLSVDMLELFHRVRNSQESSLDTIVLKMILENKNKEDE